MTVVEVVPSLCQPFGDAAVLAGSVTTWKPLLGDCVWIGITRYYSGMLSVRHSSNWCQSTLTEAWATKSVMWTSSPECASTNASNHVPACSFSTCTTCVRATEPSSLATNSRLAGCWLYVPDSCFSALEMASCKETVGVVEGTEANGSGQRSVGATIFKYDAQGFTKDDPKETTLLALLNATFATALATETPSYMSSYESEHG